MPTRWFLLGVAGLLVGAIAALADDWPQFRGPDRTDISKEKGLLKTWPKDGPKLLWKYNQAGTGFSGFAIVGDVLYTMGTHATTMNLPSLWTSRTASSPSNCGPARSGQNSPPKYRPLGATAHAATPTVDGDFVYCLGGKGELVALKRTSGEVVWRKSFVKDFKGEIMDYGLNVTGPSGWGYCESPLIDGDQLICCPGGANGWMVALDKKKGSVVWRTKEVTDKAADSSTVVATIGGVRQYINSMFKGKGTGKGGGVAGVEAKTGKLLWHFPIEKYDQLYAISPTPVVQGDLVYVTANDAGCHLLQIAKDASGKFSAKDLYKSPTNKANKVMQNDHGGVVLLDGRIYGNSISRGWTCQELKSGKEKWSDKNGLDGKTGALTYADGSFYLVNQEGEVALVAATTEEWQEKGHFTLPELSKIRERDSHRAIGAWTHPVVSGGRLFLRDQELIFCYAVR